MSVAYSQAQKQRYRITLDISAFPDFDPHQIDWEKLSSYEQEDNTVGMQTLACSGDVCEIVDLT